MFRRLFLILAVGLLPSQLLGQSVLNFPRVISSADAVTSVSVVNPTSQEVSITLTAFEASGSPLVITGVSNPFTATIPAGGNYVRLFSDIYRTTSFNGWLQVTSAASGLTGFALNSNPLNTDVDGAIAVEPASEFILPFAAEDTSVRTEMTLVNVNNDPAQATLTLYGTDGSALGTKSVSLASKALLRQNLTLVFSDVDLSAASHVKVRSDRPLAGLEVVADFKIPGITQRRETVALAAHRGASDLVYVIPQFVTGPTFASYLRVVNGSGVSQEVTLTAYKEDGTPFSGGTNPRQEVIPGNATLQVSIADYFGMPATQVSAGWIEIRGSVGYLSVGLGYGSTLTASFAMTAAVATGGASLTPVHNYLAEASTFSTALSLVNAGLVSASVDVFVLRTDGSTVGRSTLTLGSKRYVSRLVRELVPGSRDLSGAWVIVRASAPIVSALYVGSANGAALVGVAPQSLTSDFIPPPQTTASISGIASQDGVGVENATVRLTGPVTATKTTDSSGRYVFSQLPAGNYTLAISKPGVTFFPSERAVTLASENLDAIHFLAVGIAPAAAPSISLLSPSSTFGAGSALSVTVFGSGFNLASSVYLNGQALQTSYVSALELHAVVPVSLLQQTGVLTVSVITPPPGGGTSNRLEFTVNEIPANPLIEGRINVGQFPAGVAIDEGMNLVVVTNESDDNVSLVNLRTLERLGTAVAGRSPAEGIAIHERTKRAFVGNAGGDNVSVIDLNTRTEIKKITVGRFPIGVAVSDASDRVYVANGEANSVSVIDANSLAVVSTITVGSRPGGIAVTPTGSHAVVTNRADNTVSIIDLNTLAVSTVSVGQYPRGVAIDPRTNRALVVNAGQNNVAMIDIARASNVGGFPVGSAPTAIAIHAGSHSAVITNSGVTRTSPNSGAITSVSIVNLDDYSTVEVPVESQAFGVAIDQQGQRAFVANFGSNSVTVVRIPNPKPQIEDVEPKTFPVGGGSFTITVRGTGFLSTSVVTLNGKSLPTKYISPTELQAQVTPELLDELLLQIRPIQTGGEKGTFAQVVTLDFKIEVTNPGPGGGGSPPPKNPDATKIEPLNAKPLLNSVTPTSAEVDKDVVITFIGNNFSATSVINFGGNPHSPTTVEPTQMTLRILAAELRAGDVPVSVTNPPPGGGTTDVFTFHVLDNTNPVPSITSVAPSEVAAGTSSVNVVITGAGFIAATSVRLGGVAVPATVTSNRIEFNVGAGVLRNAASLPGLVTNPLPGGGTASFGLSVLNPVPSVTGFSPNIVDAGSANIELQVQGARFVESSSVVVEGTPVSTRFVNSGEIRATLSEAILRTPGKVKIGVSNPAPGGGVADAGTLTVEQPAPILESLNPASIRVDQKDVPLTLAGRNFVNGSRVLVGTAEVSTVFVNSTQLRIVLPALPIGTATISVKNPGANGKVSNSLGLQITAGFPVLTSLTPSTGVAGLPATVRIQGSNFTAQSVLTLGGVAIAKTFVSGSILDAVFTPPTPGAYDVVVSNPGVVGAVSNALPYTVVGAPTINTLLAAIPGLVPATVAAESGDLLLTINGVNFYDDAVITFGSTNLVPKTLTPTVITVQIPASLVLVPGTFGVTVRARGAVSNPVAFTVGNPNVTMTIEPSGPLTFAALGLTQTLTATAKTTLGNVVPREFAWTSSNVGVVTVNNAGLLTVVGNGEATIVATADGLFGSVVVTVAQIVNSVEVSPSSAVLTSIGATAQFSAVARDSNGQAVAGKTIVWSSDAPSIAIANSSGLATAIANGSTMVRAVVDGKQGTAAVSVGQTVAVVEVSPVAATLNALNLTQTYTALARDAKGVVISGKTFTWSSSTSGVASLSATSGVTSTVATAAGNGTTTIEASVDGKKGSASLVVNQVVAVVEVLTEPGGAATTLTSLGTTLQLRAVVRDANNQTISGKTVTWVSESPTRAGVSSSGQVTALANGSAAIRASVDGKSGTLSVTVNQAVDSLTISPTSKMLTLAGEKQRFTGTLRDANGNLVDGTITWTSSATGVATIAPVDAMSADATAVADGTTTVTASASGKSATATVNVDQAAPILELLNPASIRVDQKDVTLTLTGRNFVNGAKVLVGTVEVSATFVDSTQLKIVLPSLPIGTATISVKNSSANGKVSNSLVLQITPGIPALTSLTPASAVVGVPATVRILGTNFVQQSVVTFAGVVVPATFVSDSILDVPFTAAAPGVSDVVVSNSGVVGGVSNKLDYTVVGAPTINTSGLVPAAVAAESAEFTLTINGVNFYDDAVVSFGGANLVPKTLTSTVITVQVPASLILVPAAFGVTVKARGAVSNAVAFTVGSPDVTMTISPAGPLTFAALGLTQTLTATAKTTGGSVVPKVFQWTSSNTGVVTVSSAGVLTAEGNGTATVVATADGLFGSVSVTVAQVVSSVEVSPTSVTLTSIGATSQLSAVARDSNGKLVAGKTFTWSSDTPSIATVNGSGLATAAANGSVTLRAAVDGKEGTASVSIGQTVAMVEVSPASATLNALNLTQTYTAVAKDANGVVVSGKTFTWSSTAAGLASLSATSGVTSTVATAAGNGTTSIEASVDGKKGSASLAVNQVVAGVEVVTEPEGASTTLTALGATLQLRAVVRDANNQTIGGKTVDWASESPTKAGVSSSGLVTAVANGSAVIRATVDGKSGTLTVAVGQTVDSLTISPTSKTLTSAGEKQRFTGTLKDARGNTLDGTITWSSNANSVATIAAVDAMSADATAVANGTATITATASGKTASATVTVNQAVSTVEVSPSTNTLTALGATFVFTATVKDGLGNTITGQTVAWESSAPSAATINATTGLATAVANGTTTIKATVSGKTGTAQLIVAETIEPPIINALTATPAGLVPSAVAAESDDFLLTINGTKFRGDAIVVFGSANLTPEAVTFTTITVKVPTSLIGTPGVFAVTVAAGGALSNAVSFTVNNPVVDVMIAPSNAVTFAALGLTQTFTATAKTTGGTVVPKQFHWTSSNTSVASVNDSGLITAVGNGTATVVATADGLSGSVAVTVEQVVHSVDVSPSSASLASIGATAQFSAVVKDSNGQTIAGKTITWSSDATATATIDTAGLVTAVANGATTLRASVDGKAGTAALTVSQVVAAVEISPSTVTLASLNLTQTFTAVAKDAKGVVISGKTFTWASSTGGVASLSATSGVVSTVATAAGNGNTAIEASLDGKTGSASLTVSQVVASVQVVTDPTEASTTLNSFGATLQLRAVVKDANSQTIAGKNTAWVSESPATVGVSSTGQVTALANGTAVIRATVEDKTATLSVTVGQTVYSLTLTPTSATLASKGEKQRFTGALKDANGNAVDGTITWSSSATGVATIASLDALNADATAVANGTTTITASAAGKTATATLNVSQAVASVELSPETKTLDALADTFTFTATVKDGLGNVLTGQAIAWESTSTSVATVHPSTGLITSVANGSATIKATVGGKTATAQLIVAQAVDSIVVDTGGGVGLFGSNRSPNGVYVQVFAISSVPTMTSLGDERTFTALAKDRKGNTIPGKTVSWTSSKSDTVTVDASGKAKAVGNGTATITASVEGKSASVDQVVEQAVDSVAVSPSSATLTSLDDTVPLKATPKDKRGNAIAGKAVTWSSSSSAATVNEGLVTAVSEGTGVTITASSGGKAGNAAIAVKQEIASIEVTPARRHFNLHGLKQGFSAIAKDARGKVIGGRARVWASSRSELAEVNSSTGEVTSKGNGDVVITVTIEGKTAVATVTVAQNAARIEIDQEAVLFEGLKSTKPLVARFYDELGIEITKGITWTSSKPDVATISAAGVLTAEGNGVTTITATAEGVSASISVRVSQKLNSIVITQVGSGKLTSLGRKRKFNAKAVDPNGFEIAGKAPKWKSNNDGVAGIDENGEATGKGNGKATITAEIEGVTQTIDLDVDQIAHHIEHASGTGKLKAFKRSRQLRVLDEDGNPIAGKTVSWSSSDSDVAEVDTNGVAKANKKNGNAKVRATVDGVTVETDVDVDQDIASIEVSADGSGRVPALNRKRKFTAVGKDPDGNVVVGKSVEWLTSDGNTGPIDSDGNATAKKNGKVQITAKIGDLTSLPIDFEVSQVTSSVTVTGESSGKVPALNRKRKHTAVAKDADGSVIEGKTPAWTSSRGDLAAVDSNGEVTAKGNGSSTIKAIIDGVEGTQAFETDQQLSGVVSRETGKVKALKRTRQHIAVDPDGFDIAGKEIVWSTSDDATASVDSKGIAQAKKNGSARITATVGGQTATADIEILQEVASVTISTTESGKVTSFKHKRRSTVIVKDADGNEITGRTPTWNSSDSSVLAVDSAGDAESKKNGSSKISATVDGVASNSLTFEVSQAIATVSVAAGQSSGKFKSKNEERQYVAKDANGNAIEKPIAWRAGDSAVAEVDASGKVKSKANKKTSVSATVDGVTVSSDVDVEQVAVSVVIKKQGGQLLANNTKKDLTLQATSEDAQKQAVEGKTIQWSINNPLIAKISSTGTVTAGLGKKGKVIVTAKMDDAVDTIELEVQ